MEFIEFLLQMLMAWAVAHLVLSLVRVWMQRRFEAKMGPALQVLRALETEKLIPLTIEVANNMYLCYNSMTMDFVCQGRNLEEIADNFAKRYPEKEAALHRGDDAVLEQLKQQLRAHHENIRSIGSPP